MNNENLKIERKIYSSYAFSKNEGEKRKCNAEIFEELKKKHKIFRKDNGLAVIDGVDCNFADYDIIIGRSPKYHHAIYYVFKNVPKLTMDELALLCDHGNLCFGYSIEGIFIRVSED